MGSGKSKTADLLAKIFQCDHLDTDQLIEEKTGKSVTSIFKSEGQEYFRTIEKDVLQSIRNGNKVVSTGGGTPCYYDNMDWMNSTGITVYLEANAGLLFHRLAQSRAGRPLIESLNDIELMEQITGHLAVRLPVYRKAMITINAANMNVKSLADNIKAFKKSS